MPLAREQLLKGFLSFLDRSVSPFHAVDQTKKVLLAKGFQEIFERDTWDVQPEGKYFFTKNQSTVVAFAVGGKFKPGNGFAILGAHTDSPCPKIKPNSKAESQGYLQVAVETYGGGLWHTWFDRDLTFGGRVYVKQAGSFVQKLVHVKRPILRIPTLAIHLDREVNDKGFAPNKENHLVPILATSIKGKLEEKPDVTGRHHPLLISLIAKELGCEESQICDFELSISDTQPAAIGGALEEFVFSPRLDNLASSYCGLQGFVGSLDNDSLKEDDTTRVLVLFDHEEIGSMSSHGADSLMLQSTLRRLSASQSNPCAFEEAMAKSFIVSADQAHGVHPNYPEKHEARHRPELNKGVVIKYNANQRYATNATTACLIKEIAKRRNVPLQEVVVRNDTACGSTIGSIVAAKLGVRTVDLGTAQFSMHSIREMGGVEDVEHATRLYEGFFMDYSAVSRDIQLE